MTDIKYNEEELKIQAENLSQCISLILQSNEKLNHRFDAISLNWQGDAYESFKLKYDKVKNIQDEVILKLQASLSKLNQIAGIYSASTAKTKQANETLPTDGIFVN